MKNIEQYIQRFNSLLESTIGDVKPLINESLDISDFYTKKSSPCNYLLYVSKKKYNWDEARKIIDSTKGEYIIPIDFEKIKDTFNSGRFWNGTESGTYNIGIYDFETKEKLRNHRFDKNKIILRKKWS